MAVFFFFFRNGANRGTKVSALDVVE